jgi:uroporphyrinogen-III synthase
VAVTRALEAGERKGDRLSTMLRAAGAEPMRRPVLRVSYLAAERDLVAALERLMARGRRGPADAHRRDDAAWLFVTSPRTVRPVEDALVRAGYGWETLRTHGVRVAAVGRSTAAALERTGALVDMVPVRYSGSELLREFAVEFGSTGPTPLEGITALFPRAREASEELPRGLRALGASLETIPVYALEPDRHAAAALAKEARDGKVDVLTLTSGSAVRAVARGLQDSSLSAADLADHTRVVVLGPATAAAAEEMGLPVDAIAPVAAFRSLVDTVMGFR